MKRYTYRIMSADKSTVLYQSSTRWATREEAHPHPGFAINDPEHPGAFIEVYEVTDTPLVITFADASGADWDLICLTNELAGSIKAEAARGWRPVKIEAHMPANQPIVVYREPGYMS